MHLFAYGSLMFAPVWSRVTGRADLGVPAVLRDHRRLVVRGETYPGVVRWGGCQVQGVLYRGVGERETALLDAFEGEPYCRIEAEVMVGPTLEAAWFYLHLDINALEEVEWDPARFESSGIHRFLATYCTARGA